MTRLLLVDTTQYAPNPRSFDRAAEELGYDTAFVDEKPYLQPLKASLVHKMAYRLLRRPLRGAFNRKLLDTARRFRPTIVLAVKGAYIMPSTLRRIKEETGALLVNYATDNPFNQAVSTADLVAGIPFYDLYASTKRAIIGKVRRAGGRQVVYIMFGYNPALHFPELPSTENEASRFRCDVAFIGGADGDRTAYLEPLLGEDFSLAFYGGYWSNDRRFRPYARGIVLGRDYRLAHSGARIVLCLVRHANDDGHVMRSFEIPACGAFMLAERTDEHLAVFREGVDAAFFGSPQEMLDKIRYYLEHDDARERIARAGYARVTTGGHSYRDRLDEIVRAAQAVSCP